MSKKNVKVQVLLRLSPKARKLLRQMARVQQRTMSAIVERLITCESYESGGKNVEALD